MFKNKLSSLKSTVLHSGQTFEDKDYMLKMQYMLSNILLIILSLTLAMLAIVHYSTGHLLYAAINIISILFSILFIFILRILPSRYYHTMAHIVFTIFALLILTTFKYDTKDFHTTAWFLIFIMGVFFIFNHKIVLRYIFLFFITYIFLVFQNTTVEPYAIVAEFIFTAILGYTFIFIYEYRANELQNRFLDINESLEERVKEETEARTKILNKEKETLDFLAKNDYVTKIPNMFYLHEILDKKCKNSNKQFALAYIDLNKFKNINDVYGHSAGNKVLEIIANRLHNNKSNHTIARVGGDEFILLIEAYQSEENLKKELQLYIDTIEKNIVINNTSLMMTASIGISIFPDDHTDKEYLIKFADRAMKKSKKSFLSKYTFYAQDKLILGYSKVQLELDLHTALQKEEFTLYYQPQYHIKKKQITGIEALLRWSHPKLGILTPNYFLDLAKEIGVLKEIEKFVIHKAFESVTNWHKNYNYQGRISINLSIQKLENRKFLQEVEDNLNLHDCKGEWVEFEILETDILSDISKIQTILKELHKNNIHIAIDDFGTGHSSFSYLLLLEINKIKIDKIFVDNLLLSTRAIPIIDAIMTIAKKSNYSIVVEGVETQKQLDMLPKDFEYSIQGYISYRPMPQDKLLSLLKL